MKHGKPRYLLALRCLLALCFVFSATSCSNGNKSRDKKPNIIFLMLDTVRADHLSGYGYERETSPALDAFAKENLKAAFAMTAAPWTPASVASMFTGLYPSSHRMTPPNDRDVALQGTSRLSHELYLLPEMLKDAGYRTAGVSPNPWITKQFGYAQGFDEFHFIARAPANKVTESGREIIEQLSRSGLAEPFFLYLHFLDPHAPYNPPSNYAGRFHGALARSPFTYDEEMLNLINLYDAEIAFLDSELGKFFEYLKDKKLYDELMIVVVSDHGEQFMEHGDLRHGYKLFNEEVHIPLIIKTGRRGAQGRVIEETVSTIDIVPTILDRLSMKRPENLPGVSLLDEAALKTRRGVMSEIRKKYDMKSITDLPGNRLIMDVRFDENNPDLARSLENWVAPGVVGLFNSKQEYACTQPVQNKGLEAKLRGAFSEIHTSALKIVVSQSTTDEKIKDETIEQLKSLGYLQ